MLRSNYSRRSLCVGGRRTVGREGWPHTAAMYRTLRPSDHQPPTDRPHTAPGAGSTRTDRRPSAHHATPRRGTALYSPSKPPFSPPLTERTNSSRASSHFVPARPRGLSACRPVGPCDRPVPAQPRPPRGAARCGSSARFAADRRRLAPAGGRTPPVYL